MEFSCGCSPPLFISMGVLEDILGGASDAISGVGSGIGSLISGIGGMSGGGQGGGLLNILLQGGMQGLGMYAQQRGAEERLGLQGEQQMALQQLQGEQQMALRQLIGEQALEAAKVRAGATASAAGAAAAAQNLRTKMEARSAAYQNLIKSILETAALEGAGFRDIIQAGQTAAMPRRHGT